MFDSEVRQSYLLLPGLILNHVGFTTSTLHLADVEKDLGVK